MQCFSSAHSDLLDYTDIGTVQLVFPAGSTGEPNITALNFTIVITDDGIDEGSETIVLTATVSNEPLAWFFFGTDTARIFLTGDSSKCSVLTQL